MLCVFFRSIDTHEEGDHHRNDHDLPAPEVDPGQSIAEHSRLKQALQRVVDTRKHRVTYERENHRAGVQHPDSTKAECTLCVHKALDITGRQAFDGVIIGTEQELR